jgi:hypothetical protein
MTATQMLEMVTPTWHPWQKVTKFAGTYGRKKEGPASVSVWQRPGQVQLDFHNAHGTWATWLNLTPDEALRVAQGLIKAARAASAATTETDE